MAMLLGQITCLGAGEAAEDADAAPDDRTAEQLCSETELGRGTLRALWRWASFQVPLISHSKLPMSGRSLRILPVSDVAPWRFDVGHARACPVINRPGTAS